uniref:Ig-like domain-containing protein n=1 Tax=Lactococcus formosensis TaxID=1281486 RepID=UPI0022E3A064
ADITATATDAAGNVSAPTAGKTPADADTTAPDAPVITGITGNSTDGYTVTGTAEAGATVEIKDSTSAVIGTGTADASGNYSVTLPASVGSNANITATATDAAGNVSAPTAGKTPADADTTAPEAPVITGITGNSTDGYTVTGTAEAGTKIEIKDSTGAVIGSATADASGNYSVTLPASVGPNANITATATDAAGNVSAPTAGKTPADADTTAPDAPIITNITGNSTDGYTVTGTAEAGSTVTIKDSTGTVLGTAVTDGSGNYGVSLPASVGANADLTVTATDEAGNVSVPTAGKTPADSGDTTAPDAPIITNVTGNSADGYTVTGTAEAGSTVTIKDSTGTVVGTAVADGSGNYSVSLPASVGPNADITATATDTAGNESVPTKDKTPEDPKDSVAPSAPTITNVTGNSTDGYTVTGKAEAGSTVEIKNGAGKVIGSGLADGSGNYTVSLPKGSIGANATITATAIDAAGNESTPTTGKTPADPKDVTAPDSPKVTDVTKNPDGGYNIGGTAEPGSTVTIKDGIGNVIASGKTDDSGHFHITLPAGSVKPGDLLNITATDEAGNESTASHVQIPSGTIVPVTFGGAGGQYSNGLPASYAKGVKLPATGERDNNIQTVVGFSLLAFLSLMLTKLRRKKNVL